MTLKSKVGGEGRARISPSMHPNPMRILDPEQNVVAGAFEKWQVGVGIHCFTLVPRPPRISGGAITI